MILFFKPLNLEINVSVENINKVVFESHVYFSKFIQSICDYVNGESEDIVILENGIVKQHSKSSFICHSPFLINLNEKKVLNIVYNSFDHIVSNDNLLFEKFTKLNSESEAFLYDVMDKSDYTLELTPYSDVNSVFKAFNAKFNEENQSIFEKIIDYITLLSKIIKKDALLVCVNFESYFCKDEIDQIIQQSLAMDVHLILLESTSKYQLENADLLIIDQDLCIV